MKLTKALDAAVAAFKKYYSEEERAARERALPAKASRLEEGAETLAAGCSIVVAFVVALGALVFLIKFFWRLFP